ncbi:hypothetical protein SAMN04488514_1088 [Kriegella aquimaris]|uniref:Uncharacterized protein n=1 Tax=Kriegella aquimaris TaxID=192904 RepID=A0A1G9SKQ6_9FLAO|nr:hypothetical protein SAMN04488514_1088 [Kriegella aquimaris]
MEITANSIIKNLNPNEPVRVIDVQDFGTDLSIEYVGINSGQRNTIIFPNSRLSELERVSQPGEFSFNGDPEKFVLYTEAERIKSAYLFDPLLVQIERTHQFYIYSVHLKYCIYDCLSETLGFRN